jgi:hypothetical protein
MEHVGEALLTIVFQVLRIVVEEAPTMLAYLFFGTVAGFVAGIVAIVFTARIAPRNTLFEIGSHYDAWIRRGIWLLWLVIGLAAFSMSGFFIGAGFFGDDLAQAIVDRIQVTLGVQLPISDYAGDKAAGFLRDQAITPGLVGIAALVVPLLVCGYLRRRRPAALGMAGRSDAPKSGGVARPALESVAADLPLPAFASVAAPASAPSIEINGLRGVGRGNPVMGSVTSLKVLETTFGPVFDFDVAAADQRRLRVRWRAPLGSQLRDGEIVEVRGPVDANGILDAQTVTRARSATGLSPRWVWLALPPAIAGGSWLAEQDRDLAWWWIAGATGLFVAARWKTKGRQA